MSTRLDSENYHHPVVDTLRTMVPLMISSWKLFLDWITSVAELQKAFTA